MEIFCDNMGFHVANQVLLGTFIVLNGHLRLNWLFKKMNKGHE